MFYQAYTARKAPRSQCIVTRCMQQTGPFRRCRGSRGTEPVFWPCWKLVRAREQTRLPCEFGANPFSGSRYIWRTNKKWRKH